MNNHQSTQLIPSSLTSTVQDLSTNLKTIAPTNSETTQLITYSVVAVVIAGLVVYHYIKNQENL